MLAKNVILSLSFCILLTLTLYQCYQSFTIYSAEPTFFSSTFADQKVAELPDITACYVSDVSGTPVFKADVNVSSENWKTEIIERGLDFDNVTYGKDWDIIEYLYIRRFEPLFEDQSIITGIRLSADHDQKSKDENLFIRSHPTYGKCLTLRYSEENRPLGFYYFVAKG